MTRMRVSLVTLGDPDTMTGGYLYHRRLAEMAGEHDAEIAFASFPERPFPLARLARRRVLERVTDADVIVLDSIAAAFWGGASHGRPPVVAMAHQPPGGIDHGRLRKAVQAFLDRRAYEDVLKVMVASEALVPEMQVPHDKIVVVPPGRDVAEPDPEVRDLREGRRLALLCVGNWMARKGIAELLDAFSTLPPDAATLHLVGDTEVEPRYAAQLRARLIALEDRVRIHGKKSRGAVAAFYRDADAFVLPSYREPYGTVYGEAMAFGLPVVGWNAGNLPHLATHGVEGLVIPTGDVAALSNALHRLVEDDEFREQLGRNARQRAMTFPTWRDTARQFFEVVRSAAGR